MKIAVEGCMHGDLDNVYAALLHLEKVEKTKIDLLICCGDFQAVRNENDLESLNVKPRYRTMNSFWKYYSGQEVAPFPTIFIGGNHEASNYLWELYYGGWAAPNIYFLGFAGVIKFGNVRIGGLSGIYNARHYHLGHYERPPYNESDIRSIYHVREYDVYKLMQVEEPIDIFLSHDWPLGITDYGNWQQLVRFKPYFEKEIQERTLGNKAATELLEKLKPPYWFSAHLHCKFAASVQHGEGGPITKFLALDKCLPGRKFLQIVEIESEPGPYEIQYDEEWLAITKKFNDMFPLTRRAAQLRGLRIDMQDRQWIRDKLKSRGGPKPFDFVQTVPFYNPSKPISYGSSSGHNRNPQTESSLQFLELPYLLDDAVESRELTRNPTPLTFEGKLLVIFCVINMLNYVDRGVIASNGVNGSLKKCTDGGICTAGSGIQGDFNLNYFQDGLLSSAFMVGLLVASPIFASLAKSHNPFRLIGVGLSVWTFATAGCGASFDFWSITICRMLVGVGEASFISLTAPFIDDNAPASQKTAWLAIFYMCIPTEIALGFVYGGLVGGYLHWRYAFFGESILMLPFAILGFVMKPLQLKGFYSTGPKEVLTSVEGTSPEVEGRLVSNNKDGILAGNEESNAYTSQKNSMSKGTSKIMNKVSKFWKDMKVLLFDKVYVVNVLGYIAYNFVIGAYSYWGPKAGYDIYHMNNPDLVFGGVTIVCGIFGTLAGGFILDRMNSTINNAFKLLSGATFLGAIFCFSAFYSRNLYCFLVLFSIGELLVFATQGPVNYVSPLCQTQYETTINGYVYCLVMFLLHIFGDVPSSPHVGILQDSIHNWRATALILTSVLFISAGIWFIGIFLHSEDRYNEDSEHTSPLLEENTAESPSQSTQP